MLKLSQENKIIDLPDLNQFQIGDEVIVDASADNDRFEGVIIGIELQRLYASSYLVPSITLLHDGCVTDGFKPIDCRKVETQPPAQNSRGWQDISTAPKNTKVLAAYRNESGNWRIITACYHTQLEWSDEYGDHEEEFAPEAWYEENDSSEVIYQTSCVPTHWMPLPPHPDALKSEGSAE